MCVIIERDCNLIKDKKKKNSFKCGRRLGFVVVWVLLVDLLGLRVKLGSQGYIQLCLLSYVSQKLEIGLNWLTFNKWLERSTTIRSDKRLRVETSASETLRWPICIIISIDKTKFSIIWRARVQIPSEPGFSVIAAHPRNQSFTR